MWSVKALESLIVEPTNACNLSCRMCLAHSPDARMTRRKGFMSMELYRRIIDGTPGLNRLSLNNWGESLLHPGLIDMVRYAKRAGVETVLLCTNGLLVDQRKALDLLGAGLDVLEFSIDGLGERYQSIRGVAIDLALAAVEHVRAGRSLLGLSTRLGMVMVSSDEGEEERDAFLRYWRSRVDYVKIQPMVHAAPRTHPCPELWGTVQGRLVVLWDGTVVPCCVDCDGVLVLGNAGKESLVNVWRGPTLERLRTEHREGRFSSICASCDEVIETKFRGETIHPGQPR